jgi:hypothetical protein
MKGMALFLPLLTCLALIFFMMVVFNYNSIGQKRKAHEFSIWFVDAPCALD